MEINVIRAWLGHVGLETTNPYAEINLRMEQKALEACQPPVANSSATRPARSVWRDDAELLKCAQSPLKIMWPTSGVPPGIRGKSFGLAT